MFNIINWLSDISDMRSFGENIETRSFERWADAQKKYLLLKRVTKSFEQEIQELTRRNQLIETKLTLITAELNVIKSALFDDGK